MELVINEKKQNKILITIFGVSLFIHAMTLFMQIDFSIPMKLSESEKETKIKIKFIDQNKSRQIAQTEESKNKNVKNAKFLSEKNNHFERETKSANNGSFKAAAIGNKDALDQRTVERKKSALEKKIKNIKLSDLAIKNKPIDFSKKEVKKQQVSKVKKGLKNGLKRGAALGQTNDFLDSVPLGDFTKLNTQEYEFYGFYHRIRQKLEQFWGSNIQSEAEKIFKQGRSIATESNLVTGLTIKINEAGEIVNIHLKSTSGIKELDDAAVKSFNQAGPFPNPPKGMLKADGKAVIEWGFVVNT